MAISCCQRVACVPAHNRVLRVVPRTGPVHGMAASKAVKRTDIVMHSSGATAAELAAEFTGSTFLQFFGSTAPAALAAQANGLAVMAMIFAFGGASGAHLNPAVSLMLLLRGRMSGGKAIAYMAAQVAGCVLGALLCTVLIPGVWVGQGAGAPGTYAPAAGLSSGTLFAWEALLTAGLGLVVYGCAVAGSAFRAAAPVGIAAFVMCAIMAGGSYSGCVINPARALGPAIVFGMGARTVAVYVAGQLAGGALAAALAGLIHKE
ncbi:aquaporin-like protein [Scenedesmus sp. NREL 46B-D3]|nr:aquaporin-like protein [Scenedesmus sp. NREL 46B-D3]